MVAFFVQWIWMVAVFIGHVAQERVPFSQDKTTKTWLGWSGWPVQMASYPLHPILDFLAAFLLACLQKLLGDGPCNVPYIIVMCGFYTDLPYPLSNSTMTVWNEHTDGQTKSLQKLEASLSPFQFHLLTTTGFVGLLKISRWYTFSNACCPLSQTE